MLMGRGTGYPKTGSLLGLLYFWSRRSRLSNARRDQSHDSYTPLQSELQFPLHRPPTRMMIEPPLQMYSMTRIRSILGSTPRNIGRNLA